VKPAVGLLVHAGGALVLAFAALGSGPLVSFVAAPVVFLLVAQVLAVRRGPGPEAPRRSVGLGLLTLGFSLLLLVAAGPAVALLVAAAGLALLLWGTHTSLEFDSPPRGRMLPPGFDPLLHAGVAADETIRLGVELVRLRNPGPELDQAAAKARIAADRNREQGWLDRPERAHPIPPPLEKPQLVSCHVRGSGAAERLSFASEFEPLDPEVRDEYLALRRNRITQVTLFRDRRLPRPALIFVLGYGMGWAPLDARVAGVPWLRRDLGLDVALFALPLHRARSPGRRAGAGFLEGYPLWTNAVMGQAIWDLRRLAGYLRAEGAPAVGVFGLGSGGLAAAVLASVEEGLACAVAMTAPASLEALFWRLIGPARRAEVRAAGLTPHVLERAWARHAPLRLRPHVPHAARLVVGGLADRIVPPEQVAALWEHWGQPAVHWFPGTHVLWRGTDAIRQCVATHLRETLLSAGQPE
jgi:hypothetical protein